MLCLFNQVPGDGLLLSLKFKCFFLHFVYQLSELKLETYLQVCGWSCKEIECQFRYPNFPLPSQPGLKQFNEIEVFLFLLNVQIILPKKGSNG